MSPNPVDADVDDEVKQLVRLCMSLMGMSFEFMEKVSKRDETERRSLALSCRVQGFKSKQQSVLFLVNNKGKVLDGLLKSSFI